MIRGRLGIGNFGLSLSILPLFLFEYLLILRFSKFRKGADLRRIRFAVMMHVALQRNLRGQVCNHKVHTYCRNIAHDPWKSIDRMGCVICTWHWGRGSTDLGGNLRCMQHWTFHHLEWVIHPSIKIEGSSRWERRKSRTRLDLVWDLRCSDLVKRIDQLIGVYGTEWMKPRGPPPRSCSSESSGGSFM